MLFKPKIPYIRDLYLAYLIEGANRTDKEGYPIIEKWMIATEPPKEIIQWNRRQDVENPDYVGMSFYCNDEGFTPIINNPKRYIEKLKRYYCLIGLDASPYDNMPPVVQKSQIYINLALTYYYGMNGIKVIPNVRLGGSYTLDSLDAYPKNTLIAIGTNGFIKNKTNLKILKEQINYVVDYLSPKGICVYGPALKDLFEYAKSKNVVIYQFNSYTMNNNLMDKMRGNKL